MKKFCCAFYVQSFFKAWYSIHVIDKGQRPYPFCHTKRQSDVLGIWVGKKYLS